MASAPHPRPNARQMQLHRFKPDVEHRHFEISIERFAHNLDDAELADNDAAPASNAPIDADGPVAYRSTLPVDELVAALRAEGIPASASRDAGGFLCNHVFYSLMRVLEQERPEAIGGFVHVPLLPEQALAENAASMPLETLVRAARVIVACVGSTEHTKSGGAGFAGAGAE